MAAKPCGCGGSKSNVATSLPMATFDGPLYSGTNRFSYVYVVAKGTDQERVFARDDLEGATAYSAEVRKGIVAVPAGTLPASAVATVYSA